MRDCIGNIVKPVYPFQAGDVVECLSTNHHTLKEGQQYTVMHSFQATLKAPDLPASPMEYLTSLLRLQGYGHPVAAADFCAPGESRVELRRRIAELENTLVKARAEIARHDSSKRGCDASNLSRAEFIDDVRSAYDRYIARKGLK